MLLPKVCFNHSRHFIVSCLFVCRVPARSLSDFFHFFNPSVYLSPRLHIPPPSLLSFLSTRPTVFKQTHSRCDLLQLSFAPRRDMSLCFVHAPCVCVCCVVSFRSFHVTVLCLSRPRHFHRSIFPSFRLAVSLPPISARFLFCFCWYFRC